MFNETNENNVNSVEPVPTENTQAESIQVESVQTDNVTGQESQPQDVNPYLTGAGGGSAEPPAPAVSPIPEEPKKKDNTVKIVVGLLIVAVIALIAVIIFMFTRKGAGSDPKEIVEEALKETFEESGEYLADVWDLEQYEGMFEGNEFTLEADLDATGGIDINMLMQQKEDVIGFNIEAKSFGISIGLDGYIDDREVRIALPGMLDYVFTVDRETLSEDIWNLVDEGMIDEETAEEIIALNEGQIQSDDLSVETAEKLGGAVLDSWTKFYDRASMEEMKDTKKLEVNGQDRDCKGYQLSITYGDAADFIEEIVDLYLENDEFKAVLDAELISSGYSESDLEDIYDELNEEIDDFLVDMRKDSEENIVIDFYLYDGKIAQVYTKVDKTEIEWNVQGGNFPLENTSLTFSDRYSELELSRTGSMEKGEHRAEYVISDEYEEFVIDVRYEKETGDYYFDFLYDDDSILFMSGTLEKEDDSTLVIVIDSFDIEEEYIFDGTITISGECDDINKPKGEEKEVFFMDEDDWDDIYFEILYSLY